MAASLTMKLMRTITTYFQTELEGSYLDIRLKKLGLRTSLQRVEIRTADIQFQSFNANLHTGSIQINPSNNTVAENLAVIWSICILYVLCAPRDTSRPIKIKETGMTKIRYDLNSKSLELAFDKLTVAVMTFVFDRVSLVIPVM